MHEEAKRIAEEKRKAKPASVPPPSAFLIQLDPEHPGAKVPTRGSALAAGYDIYASEKTVIPKGGRVVVPTGLRLRIPEGCYGRIAPRSGLAVKHGIDTGAGVIDADYRGLLGLLMFNFGEADFTFEAGDRIAQLILERIATPEVTVVQALDATTRGEGKFGSTGGFGAASIVSQ